ncbi:MAG TPA: dihydrodipicolinate synthase family protein [Pseudolysinimonas sp.]|nr:dihydrodipicolinate synthase family protein [Pseudolysinimonas sp.]
MSERKMRDRLTPADLRGIFGIIPTPSKPGSDSPFATDTVDLAETERMVEAIVASGINIIMTNGTFGEVATLTLDELLEFNDVVIRTVAGRVPVFSGATASNTRDTVSRGRALRDLGADGLFVGRPMWLPLDDTQIVDYYGAVAEAIPESALVIYDNTAVFKGKISSEAYAGLAGIPQIVASKHVGLREGSDDYARDLEAVGDAFHLLPTADSWLPTGGAFRGRVHAAWSGDVACGPEPLIALSNALRDRDMERAQQVHADIAWATETLFPDHDITKFMPYSIQIDRAEFEAAGYITPGPARHPYTSAPEEYIEGGAETGRRWAELRTRYPLPAEANTEGARA